MARLLARREREIYLQELNRTADEWLPVVRRLRPARPWAAVTRVVGAFVAEGLAEPVLLEKASAVRGDDRLMVLVAGIAPANPAMTLRKIGAQLEAMREATPAGRKAWAAASVRSLLERARRAGLVDTPPRPRGPRPGGVRAQKDKRIKAAIAG